MSDSVAEQEREKYSDIWDMPEYRVKCHSLDLWLYKRELFPAEFASALDIGSGLGKLFAHWNNNGVDAWAVDIVPNALTPEIAEQWGHRRVLVPLWDMVWDRQFDIGVCADVMEHIPEEMVPKTLERIAACCGHVVFKIANFPSDSLGYRLHMTQRDADWWAEQIRAVCGTVERHKYPTQKKEYWFTWKTQ